MFSIENLNASYKQGFRLHDISFTAHKGEITGIIGPNGSGKTTLIKALCKDIPARGKVYIDQKNLLEMNLPARAACLSLVPQHIEKLPLSVLDYVLTGRTPYHRWFRLHYDEQDFQLARQAMDEAGLTRLFSQEELSRKLLSELSGGERQLAALAKALCQDAPVLLLDEPTASLDLANQVKTLERIREITVRNGRYTLLVIHDVNLAAAYCSRLVFISHGQVVCQGDTESVFTQENMERVYQTPLCISAHPLSGKPIVLPK